MSIAEVATVLGKSERQVRYLIRRGKLKARKEGKSWRIASESLPLNETQRHELGERLTNAREQVEAALEPVAKAVAGVCRGGSRATPTRG